MRVRLLYLLSLTRTKATAVPQYSAAEVPRYYTTHKETKARQFFCELSSSYEENIGERNKREKEKEAWKKRKKRANGMGEDAGSR